MAKIKITPLQIILTALLLLGGIIFLPRFFGGTEKTDTTSLSPDIGSQEISGSTKKTALKEKPPVEKKNPLERNVATICNDSFGGYIAASRALEFSDLKMQVEVKEVLSQSDRAASLGNDCDIILTTLGMVLQYTPEGELVAILDVSKADAIVFDLNKLNRMAEENQVSTEGRPTEILKKIAEKNVLPEIAVSLDTPSETLLGLASKNFPDEFSHSYYEIVDGVEDSGEALKLLNQQSNNVVAAVLWEPDVAEALKKESRVVVVDSKQFPHIIDVAVVSDALLVDNKEVVQEFVDELYAIQDGIPFQSSGRKYRELLRKATGTVGPNLEKMIADINPVSSAKALRMIKDGTIEASARELSELHNNLEPGTISDLDLGSLINTTFLEETVSKSQSTYASQQEQWTEGVEFKTASQAQKENAVEAAKPKTEVAAVYGVKSQDQVVFPSGRAIVTDEAKKQLDVAVSRIAAQNPDTVLIRVSGYASDDGYIGNNYLAGERARQSVNYLKSKLPDFKFEAVNGGVTSYDSSIDPTDEKNQRIVITIVR